MARTAAGAALLSPGMGGSSQEEEGDSIVRMLARPSRLGLFLALLLIAAAAVASCGGGNRATGGPSSTGQGGGGGGIVLAGTGGGACSGLDVQPTGLQTITV